MTATTERGSAPSARGTADDADPSRAGSLTVGVPARVLGAFEEMAWLDTVGQLYEKATGPITGAGPVRDVLLGRWLGHALHPVLSDLPLGFWTSSAACDLAGEDGAAQLLGVAGSVTALAAAASGGADWSVSDGRERRLGLLHGLVNVAGLTLEVGSLIARHRGRRSAARVLGLGGLAVSGVAAWVGGELVFSRGLRVDHTAWTAGPAEWTGVLGVDELSEGRPRGVEVEGRTVLLLRRHGAVFAIENACSHAGGPLCEGSVEGDVVTCPWHGSRIRMTDGATLSGPAVAPQPRLQTRIREGRVELRGRMG